MPRCFMAKKLKYPYEQWKQEQNQQKDSNSRSPSPKDGQHYHLEESNNLASEAGSESGQHEKITHSKFLSHKSYIIILHTILKIYWHFIAVYILHCMLSSCLCMKSIAL